MCDGRHSVVRSRVLEDIRWCVHVLRELENPTIIEVRHESIKCCYFWSSRPLGTGLCPSSLHQQHHMLETSILPPPFFFFWHATCCVSKIGQIWLVSICASSGSCVTLNRRDSSDLLCKHLSCVTLLFERLCCVSTRVRQFSALVECLFYQCSVFFGGGGGFTVWLCWMLIGQMLYATSEAKLH